VGNQDANGKPTILRFDGTSWISMAASIADVTGGLEAVWGVSAGSVYAVGDTVARYNGTSWVKVTGAPALVGGDYYVALWGRADNDIFVTTGYGNTYHFDGAWTPLQGGGFHAMWGTATEVFGVSHWGIARYSGGGWADQASPCGYALNGIWGAGKVVYAVGEGGAILSTTLSP